MSQIFHIIVRGYAEEESSHPFPLLFFNNSPRESDGICFTGVGLCLSVCLSVTTITKKIVDGFVPNFMGRFLGETEDQVRVSLRS